jgi:hypothetical protein
MRQIISAFDFMYIRDPLYYIHHRNDEIEELILFKKCTNAIPVEKIQSTIDSGLIPYPT